MNKVFVDGENLTIDQVISVARSRAKVKIAEEAISKINLSREVVENLLKRGNVVYGINTGVGELCTKRIPSKDIKKLQVNLVRSHCTGVGRPLSNEEVRASMLVRANTLAKGYSGVRLELVEMLTNMLSCNISPVIPEKGSVGTSGDLVPLAHLASVLIGEGEACVKSRRVTGKEALATFGIKPLTLKAKEGLALINGTSVMTGIAALVVHDATNLIKVAELAGACSLEALKGTDKAFDERIFKVRKHKGAQDSAKNLKKLLRNSEILPSHRKCPRVQDAYSIRCMPQVIGAARDVLRYTKNTVEIELNSATDNPLIFETGSLSGGNFHGEPLALAMDFLAIAFAEITNIAERRIARLIDEKLSGLPPFLTKKSGLNSGCMALQYTAASLASENKLLASPASIDSIPTCANQEDHVSMGTTAARKARKILSNVKQVLAIELFCALQGLEYEKLKPGVGVEEAYRVIRKKVPKLSEDRALDKDIQEIIKLIRDGELVHRIEQKAGTIV